MISAKGISLLSVGAGANSHNFKHHWELDNITDKLYGKLQE